MSYDDNGKATEGLLRFNLAMQRSRAFCYLLAFSMASLAMRAGVLTGTLREGLIILFCGIGSAALFYSLYRVRGDLDGPIKLYFLSLLVDTVLISWSVYVSGGVSSPWYLFYVAISAAAAFAGGSAAAWAISSINAVSYLTVLLATGLVTLFSPNFYLALYQIGFLYFTAVFFFRGIGNLRKKRLIIKQLREEDQRRVQELTHLTNELNVKSQELVTANRTIRESDRLKSQFLANMSHELRTPMNAIIGFSEILSDRLGGEISEKHHGFVKHILSSGQHLLGIINDILDLSKIEAGRMELFPEVFRIDGVASEVVNVMRAQATRVGIEIETEIPKDLPPIETDLPKFRQIMLNLISNAVKFSPDNSQVQVIASLAGDKDDPEAEISISVIDHGPGIATEALESVFDEFRQLDAPPRDEFKGTGLGLALVKRFCELLGGRVVLESELGKGSTFIVTLPVRYAGVEPVADYDSEENVVESSDPRVLVVEDDAVAFEAISRHLASASYLAVRARHGDEALRLARQIKPIAITLDLVLPGVDGWEVLKRLKADEETQSIPVVVISMIDNKDLGLALGAHDYLVKPVDRKRLVERIKQVTGSTTRRGPRRLLVIDDDPKFRDLLLDELTSLKYEVSWALSGEDGLALARNELPDAIVLDLVMPGMSGFEVAEELKQDESTVHIPILVMTSKELTTDDRSLLHSRIAALVPKGRSPASRLITAIQQLR